MNIWNKYRIGDCCEVTSSKRVFLADYVESGIPFYRSKEIAELQSCTPITTPLYISEEKYKDIKTKYGIPQKGDLLLTAIGATLGIPYLIKDNEPFYFKDGNLIWFKNFNPQLSSEYLYLWMVSSYGYDSMQNVAIGSAQKALTIAALKDIAIEIPPIEIQKKISCVLTAYDNLIENNNKRIRLLEQMAENLYKEWFVRFRFPGHEKAEFENGLPKGWKIEKLGNVANISTGKCNREDAEEEGLYPLFDRSQEIKKSSEWLKDCEAIIVPGEGTSFIPRYYWGKFNLHQRCYCVEPKFENTGKYLFYVLMLNRKYFLSVATGATVPSLRYNNFAKMSFVLPEKTLCEKYNGIVTTYFEEINSLKASNQILSRQRDLLLPRLMSGKLEVKV